MIASLVEQICVPRKRHEVNAEMARSPPDDGRFCREWYLVIWQSELNPHGLSGAERNERTHCHSPFAHVHAVAANFRHVLPLDSDWNGFRIAKITTAFPQDQSVGSLEGAADGLGERGLSKTKLTRWRNAELVAFSSRLPTAKITAVRFDGERWAASRTAPDCSPTCRSTITASNFRQFNRRIDAGPS